MYEITLKNQRKVPSVGQGTWHMGEDPGLRSKEIESLQAGIELGMTLIDTAEMYGEGKAELLVGEAIKPYDREKLFLVSKVYPWNAGLSGMSKALDASLKRLGTDYLDLYLYHWRGSISLQETVYCLDQMKRQGKIRDWGVSNFDLSDMEELYGLNEGPDCLVNQVLYHPGSRGIEWSLLPWMRRQNVTLMSYCPLAQAGSLRRGLFSSNAIVSIARKYGVEPSQVLLAWNIRNGCTIAIPKSGNPEHTRQNAAAANLSLTLEDLKLIDQAFHPPVKKTPLDMQ